jgi:1,4-dihydroxy-2-naphthoyl-CoA hydrolase
MALADTAGALWAFLHLPGGAGGTTTIESKPDFLRAMREGHVEAIARPLHTGPLDDRDQTDLRDAEGGDS